MSIPTRTLSAPSKLAERVLLRRSTRISLSLPRVVGPSSAHLITPTAAPRRTFSSTPTRLHSLPSPSSFTASSPSSSTPTPPLQPYKTHRPTPSVPNSPLIHSFYDNPTATFSFLVVCPSTKECLVVDPVLDYDQASGEISQKTVKGLKAFADEMGYKVVAIVETHVHADHLTGAWALKNLLPNRPPIAIGHLVTQVQHTFSPIYHIPPSLLTDTFDIYLQEHQTLKFGDLEAVAQSLPGHTPDSMGLKVGDAVFVGDSLFLPDVGTARADFPGGDPEALYASIQSLFKLQGDFRLFSGHDYPSGREKSCFALVSDQIASNKHVGRVTPAGDAATLATFVAMRKERDASLGQPRLIHAALQVNLRAGRMPPADEEGRRFLRVPVGGDLPPDA